MAQARTGTGIIFIERTRIDIYSSSLGNVIQFLFPPTSVRDLEVLNTEELKTQLRTMITNSKMLPSTMIIVLDHTTLYERDFLDNPQVPTEPSIQKYIDNVPFEEVSVKRFPIEKGVKVVVGNKYLFETVKKAFEMQGFSIRIVLPAQVFGQQIAVLDGTSVPVILHKLDSVKQHNMLAIPVSQSLPSAPETPEKKKKNKVLLVAVIILFTASFILIAIALAPVIPRFLPK